MWALYFGTYPVIGFVLLICRRVSLVGKVPVYRARGALVWFPAGPTLRILKLLRRRCCLCSNIILQMVRDCWFLWFMFTFYSSLSNLLQLKRRKLLLALTLWIKQNCRKQKWSTFSEHLYSSKKSHSEKVYGSKQTTAAFVLSQ